MRTQGVNRSQVMICDSLLSDSYCSEVVAPAGPSVRRPNGVPSCREAVRSIRIPLGSNTRASSFSRHKEDDASQLHPHEPRWHQGRRHRQRHERGQGRSTAHEDRQRIAPARQRTAVEMRRVSKLARKGGFDYVLVVSTGISEPLPVTEPRLGRRTALSFPLLPPPQKN
jgi:hypothetical protein